MTGFVQNLQACVSVALNLPDGTSVSVEFVIDTGFEGALSLPAETVAALKLPFELELDSILADGSTVATPVHSATIVWQDRTIEVAVLALGERPLLGTALLEGCRLDVDFFDGGSVAISSYRSL
jgi:clan AA aspartic protease